MNDMLPISRLPVEILRSILDLALGIRESKLTNPRARFNQYILSSSEYLLVSKLWLEVGLPLLYRTVILRSAAQVCALKMTLLDHPNFGIFVKNLRIEEGAYYSGIEEITERMPQVEILVLSLVVYSFVDAPKVCHALKYLTPTRLVLYDIGSTINRNRSLDAVVESICRMITSSSHLDVFESRVWWRKKMFALPRTLCFADALARVPKLRLVAVSCSRNTGIPGFVSTLLSRIQVARICVIDCTKRMKGKIRDTVFSSSDAENRLVYYDQFCQLYDGKGTKQLPFKSCSASPVRLPDCVMKKIVALALTSSEMLSEDLFSDGIDDTGFSAFKKTSCSLTRVSRSFRSFVQPFKFLQVAIADFYNGMLFMKELVHESASVLVRSVYLDSDPRLITDVERKARDVVLSTLCKMSHITELALPTCPGDIRLLAQYLGRSLTKLDLCLKTNLVHYTANAATEIDLLYPEYFSGFETLEVLWLRCSNELPRIASTGTNRCTSNFALSKKVTFKRLRALVIQDYEDGTVFDLITSWDLSTIRRLSFAGSLVRCSQSEITRVYDIIGSILETATVETLGLGHGAVGPDIEILMRSFATPTLRKIELCFK
ncbi:hypothetical protein ACEPAG_4008 [Sanghuangporus baumii]